MTRGWMIALALVATEASADEEFVFHEALVQQCYDNAVSGKSQDCVGSAADLCMAQNEGGWSTYGMNFCIGEEFAWWDAVLNREYQRVMVASKQVDTDMAGMQVPSVAGALRDMQRAWIGFRDGTCLYEVSKWSNGTGAGPAHAGCMMRLTAEQALYLAGEGHTQ